MENETGPSDVPSTDYEYAVERVTGANMPLGLMKGHHRTKLQRLKDMRKGLEAKLEEVNKAISLLEANPQINEIIEALEKAGV